MNGGEAQAHRCPRRLHTGSIRFKIPFCRLIFDVHESIRLSGHYRERRPVFIVRNMPERFHGRPGLSRGWVNSRRREQFPWTPWAICSEDLFISVLPWVTFSEETRTSPIICRIHQLSYPANREVCPEKAESRAAGIFLDLLGEGRTVE